MEQLLFLLFVLFSVVSALLERRKRRRQLEEQSRQQPKRPPLPRKTRVPEISPEEKVGWPFGGELAEIEIPPLSPSHKKQIEKVEAESQARERETLDAERRAQDLERHAQELERRARTGQVRQSVSELLRQRAAQEQAWEQPAGALRQGRWKLDRKQARDAIVYAEILGRPRAERRENS